MTDETILAAVHTWGKENRLNYEAHILDAPPEHLDLRPVLNPENLTVNRSGVCLTVKEPEPTHKTPLSVDIWIPTSGNQGSFLICHEGNAKSKDWFDYLAFTVVDHNEIRKEGLSALVGNLDFIKRDFYQESRVSGNNYHNSNWLQSDGGKGLKSFFASSSWRDIFSNG